MKQGDKLINNFTLEIYTYKEIDNMGNVVLLNSNGDIRHVGERYFSNRYVPYSDEEYHKLKSNKLKEKRCSVCEKDVSGLEWSIKGKLTL